jgi:hypothetical protein
VLLQPVVDPYQCGGITTFHPRSDRWLLQYRHAALPESPNDGLDRAFRRRKSNGIVQPIPQSANVLRAIRRLPFMFVSVKKIAREATRTILGPRIDWRRCEAFRFPEAHSRSNRSAAASSRLRLTAPFGAADSLGNLFQTGLPGDVSNSTNVSRRQPHARGGAISNAKLVRKFAPGHQGIVAQIDRPARDKSLFDVSHRNVSYFQVR